MIIKEVFAEQVLRLLNGGDYSTATSIKKQDVYIAAEQARNYLIEKYVNLQGDDIIDEFVSVYDDVVVKKNEKRNRLYIELPAQLISLRDGKGMRHIGPMQDEANPFIFLKGGNEFTYDGLEAGNIEGRTGYWIEGASKSSETPIAVFKNMPVQLEGKELLVKMVSSIYSLDEDAYIPIPAIAEIEYLQLVLEIMKGQKTMPKDKTADNNETV